MNKRLSKLGDCGVGCLKTREIYKGMIQLKYKYSTVIYTFLLFFFFKQFYVRTMTMNFTKEKFVFSAIRHSTFIDNNDFPYIAVSFSFCLLATWRVKYAKRHVVCIERLSFLLPIIINFSDILFFERKKTAKKKSLSHILVEKRALC